MNPRTHSRRPAKTEFRPTQIRPAGEINSAVDIARLIVSARDSRRLLFRGQNVDEPLRPKIARIAEEKGIPFAQVVQIERQMLDRFKKESVPLLQNRQPQNTWEWLSVAQHQGLATRLLDWTANALAGLWFAVATDPPGRHGVVWVLEVSSDNERTPTAKENIFRLKRTFVFQPFHLDRRIVAQSAWFSVHRYSETAGNFIPLDKNVRFRSSLRKYTVSRKRFGAIRRELRLLGVTQASLFPDLSGLCAEIQADCIGSWQPLTTI